MKLFVFLNKKGKFWLCSKRTFAITLQPFPEHTGIIFANGCMIHGFMTFHSRAELNFPLGVLGNRIIQIHRPYPQLISLIENITNASS